jgi:hypothetical protein
MKPTDNIERLMQTVRLSTSQSLDDRILNHSTEALARARHEQPATGRIIRIGRFLMQNQYARFAAAAIVIAAVGFGLASLTVLNNGVGQAYAFGQTVQAMHSVRSLHMKFGQSPASHAGELWAEFDADGQVLRCSCDYPQTEDGHKIVYWHDGKAYVWLKDKKAFLTIADKTVALKILDLARDVDPKLLVSRLQEAQVKGEVEIRTEQMKAGSPIVLTVTWLPTSQEPTRRQILHVDPATKLVVRIEDCRKTQDQYHLEKWFEILEYNQPIDPTVFSPQLPEGIMRIDQTAQPVGLPQGEMTNEQAAREVVRQFFQALIDKDYAKAGQMFSGMPASKMQEMAEKMKMPVVRIISIGEPTPHAVTRGLKVPVIVEVDDNGQLHEWSPNGPFVRQVESDKTRWQIIGGI